MKGGELSIKKLESLGVALEGFLFAVKAEGFREWGALRGVDKVGETGYGNTIGIFLARARRNDAV